MMLETLLPYLLAAVVSLAGLFAPALTARINRGVTERDRREQLNQQKLEHLRAVFERYLMAAGEYIGNPNNDTLQTYLGAYTAALFYAPEKAKMQMKVLNHRLYKFDFDQVTDLLNLVVDDLQTFLDQLSLEK